MDEYQMGEFTPSNFDSNYTPPDALSDEWMNAAPEVRWGEGNRPTYGTDENGFNIQRSNLDLGGSGNFFDITSPIDPNNMQTYASYGPNGKLLNWSKEHYDDGNPFGPVLAMALSAGLGGPLANMFGGGSLGQIGASSVLGGANSALSGGNPLTGALTGGLGGGLNLGSSMLDLGGKLGLPSNLSNIFNKTLASTAYQGITGGDPKQSLMNGALQGGLSFLGGSPNTQTQGANTMDFPGLDQQYSYGNTDWSNLDQGNQQYQNPMPNLNQDITFSNQDYGGLQGMMGDNTSYFGPQGTGPGVATGMGGPSNGSSGSSNPIMDAIRGALKFSGGGNSAQGANNLGSIASSLMGLYSSNQKRRQGQNLQQLGSGLQSMFTENSPYSQALQQQLERRDAASGRRSQYGPRNVELQARLAEMNSRNALTLSSIYQAQNQNSGQATNQSLNNILMLMKNPQMQSMLQGWLGGNDNTGAFDILNSNRSIGD